MCGGFRIRFCSIIEHELQAHVLIEDKPEARLLQVVDKLLELRGGLLGFAFRQGADTQGAARGADLAEGIYLALVTTVEGLIVAIPSLAAFAVFRNRVDHLVAEATYVAQHVFTPLKRNRVASPPRAVTPPKAPPAPPPGGKG